MDDCLELTLAHVRIHVSSQCHNYRQILYVESLQYLFFERHILSKLYDVC